MNSVIKDQSENIKNGKNISQKIKGELNYMLYNNKSEIKANKRNEHNENSIKCLINCTQYKLNLTIKQGKTFVGYQFINNNTYFYPNISSNQIITLLKQKEENEGININNKLTLEKLFENNLEDNKILNKNITFPINNNDKNNEISIFNNDITLNKYENNSCILIEFDLDNYKGNNKYFKIINKSFIEREIKCSFNGIVHLSQLLKNDIFFSIEPKRLIKSIENRIEDYKNDYLKLNNKNKKLFRFASKFFTPLIKVPNIGILFSTNNRENLINIDTLKSNFNSIISKKFILLKLFIAINITDSIKKETFIIDDILNKKNEIISLENFDYLNNQLNINATRSYIPRKKIQNNFLNILKENEKENFDLKTKETIINEENKFSKEIYKIFKTKSNYLSNFIIFKKTIKNLFPKIKMNNLIPLENNFQIFERISSFGLLIPIINEEGNYNKLFFSPSLSSMIIYIKNKELYEIINNKLNGLKEFRLSASTRSNSEENNNTLNNYFQVNDFYSENTKTLLYDKYILIEFNECKPPFLRSSLIEQIKNIFYPFSNSNFIIKLSDIDLEKSFFSISWNPYNNHFNHTSFLTYYLFNFNLIGILPFKLDVNKWFSLIKLNNLQNVIDKKDIYLKKNISKVENFLFNLHYNELNIVNFNSVDYDFFLKNKYSNKKDN